MYINKDRKGFKNHRVEARGTAEQRTSKNKKKRNQELLDLKRIGVEEWRNNCPDRDKRNLM